MTQLIPDINSNPIRINIRIKTNQSTNQSILSATPELRQSKSKSINQHQNHQFNQSINVKNQSNQIQCQNQNQPINQSINSVNDPRAIKVKTNQSTSESESINQSTNPSMSKSENQSGCIINNFKIKFRINQFANPRNFRCWNFRCCFPTARSPWLGHHGCCCSSSYPPGLTSQCDQSKPATTHISKLSKT